MTESLTPRQRYLRRWEALKAERSTWLEHYRQLDEQVQPRRSRFLDDANRSRRNDKIINARPRIAARTLAAGMMAGITSPSRPWFRLSTPDPELAEAGPVRAWLHQVEERLRLIFAKSNLYNALAASYAVLPTYGITALHVEEDDEDLVRGWVYPVGQYALAANERGRVDTVYRELKLTVSQTVEKFGLESCSRVVREAYAAHELDRWVKVLHVVEPRRDRQLGRAGPAGMPVRSCWLELEADESTGFLRESGYEEMPTLCPRWEVNGEDVYGFGPGMDALGDCKALQLLEKRKAQLVDKLVNPPMGGPEALLHRRPSLLPGDFTALPNSAVGAKVEPLMVIHPQALPAVNELIARHEERIDSAFFADLWLMLAQSEGQMTAREVAERHEEKMMQLGPVLERLEDELLDPLIDRVFGIALRNGQIPEPPEELEGVELKVDYVSIVAQAQKLLGSVTGIERFAGFVGNVAQLRPDALDKVNVDELLDTYADAIGIPPDLLHSDEEVAAVRNERAAQAQAQMQGQAMAQAAASAKDLSGASLESDNALNRLLGGMGVAPPAGGV